MRSMQPRPGTELKLSENAVKCVKKKISSEKQSDKTNLNDKFLSTISKKKKKNWKQFKIFAQSCTRPDTRLASKAQNTDILIKFRNLTQTLNTDGG